MDSQFTGQGVVFVVPGDLHLEEPDRENHLVARQVVDEVNRLVRPDFVQFIGDNVQHARECEFQLFRELTARLACPHFSLVGDHDRNGSDIPEEFIQFVGNPYGSTELRGFRFIRVNSQEVRPAGFSEEQLDWMTEELQAAQSKQQRVVIFQHNYPFKVFEQFAGPGINRWRSLLDEYPPVAVLCGHTHYAQLANDGRHAYIATRSIGDPEGGPAGYLLGFVAGDDFAVKHRTVAESRAAALIVHPRDALLATNPRHIVSVPDEIRARAWSLEPICEMQCRVDEQRWYSMRRDADEIWRAPLDTVGLAKGSHLAQIVAMGEGGEIVARDEVTFMFDPTGRYTPVPSVRPVVTHTAFC